MQASNENLSPAVVNRLCKELKELSSSPPEGIRIIINEQNIADIQADLEGPAGTPFEGGLFRMKLVLGQDFPVAPPKGYFVTKVFHPNVSNCGEICVNTLKKDWKSELGISHILLVVRCLLIVPFAESALNEEAGKMLLEDYEEFARRARLFTEIYARRPTVKVEPVKQDISKDAAAAAAAKKRVTGAKTDKSDKIDQKAVERKRSMKRL